MMRRATWILLVLVVALGACGDDAGAPSDGDVSEDAATDSAIEPFDPLVGIGAVELVMSGFTFLEGPQWRDAEGDLVFTDIPANRINRLKDGVVTPLDPASSMANGLALDADGTLLSARHASRNVVRGGTELVGQFEGEPFNSPNDVIVASDGSVFFTDPPYGLGSPTDSDLGFMGVFQWRTDGTVEALHRGAMNERPNGIGISPDGKRVYYADTATATLWAYLRDGDPPGFVELTPTASNPDGLAIDTGGNIFVTTAMGVEAYGPDGHRWGVIPVPQQPANCAFGDPDHRTLYITARTGLYKVRLAHPGLPTH